MPPKRKGFMLVISNTLDKELGTVDVLFDGGYGRIVSTERTCVKTISGSLIVELEADEIEALVDRAPSVLINEDAESVPHGLSDTDITLWTVTVETEQPLRLRLVPDEYTSQP